MDTSKIPSRKKVFCRELNTGDDLNGTFYYDDDSIEAEIFGFKKPFFINGSKPIYLHSENNQIISLLSNITTPAASSSRLIEPQMTTYKQHIMSNSAVIGHDKWEESDLIKQVSFSVKHADSILTNFDLHDSFVKHGLTEQDHSKIFTIEADNLIIRAYYCAMYMAGFDEPREILPRIDIEFANDVTLKNYLEHVSSFIQFLSLSIGVHLTPSDITIDRLTLEDQISAIESQSYPGDYSVIHIWSAIDISDQSVHIAGSLINMRDTQESEAFTNCLKTWLSRNSTWRKANALMMGCLSKNRVISEERLLSACKWFEEIPLTTVDKSISDEHIGEITTVALSRANELGYGDIGNRIFGSLKAIKTESNNDRFRRLVSVVEARFGKKVLDEDIVHYLNKAIKIRGNAAHGLYAPSTDDKFFEFSKSIYAMEALCFLITVKDLPISSDALKRIHSHSLTTNYRLLCKSR